MTRDDAFRAVVARLSDVDDPFRAATRLLVSAPASGYVDDPATHDVFGMGLPPRPHVEPPQTTWEHRLARKARPRRRG
jgi:hypothetical protein